MHAPASPHCWPFPLQTHAEASQTKPLSQTFPHPLQLFLSRVTSTQTPPHRTVGAGQAQAPPVQIAPPVQARPQPPQFSPFDCRSTQAPAQFVRPGSQEPLQAPRLHT